MESKAVFFFVAQMFPEFSTRSCNFLFWGIAKTQQGIIQSPRIHVLSWQPKGTPPYATPPKKNKALIRPNYGTMVVNNPLIRPYFLGGVA